MLVGNEVTLSGELAGMPVELSQEMMNQFESSSRMAIIEQVIPHYHEGMVYVYMQALTSKNSFQRFVVPANKDWSVKLLTDTAGETLQRQFRAYGAKNLGTVVAETGSCRVGTDPEIFAVDDAGVMIPAFAWLPDKAHAKEFNSETIIPDKSIYKGPYWDGFQAEFNPNSENCLAYHTDRIQEQLKETYHALTVFNPKARLTIQSVLDAPPEILQSCLTEHAVLGCNASSNVYNIAGQPVDDARMLPFRMAGGHIHFGRVFLPGEVDRCVRALDAIVGVAAVSLAASFDKPCRRVYYGLPGEYRLPPHGLEYRTLSNFWLTHPAITHLTIDLARQAMRVGMSRNLKYWQADEALTIDTIKNCDVKAARKILETNKDVLLGLFAYSYRKDRQGDYNTEPEVAAEISYRTIMNGIESAVADPDDIKKNWSLTEGWKRHCKNRGSMWGTAVALLASNELL